MKQVISTLCTLAILAGCASSGTNQVQADLPVDTGTVRAGEGSIVTVKGGEMPLAGLGEVRVGEPLPAAVLSNAGLQPVNRTSPSPAV